MAASRHVGDYNFNNTYQYIVNREDTHVRWLQDAILDLGGTPEDQPEPDLKPEGKKDAAQRSVITADRDGRAEVQRALDAPGRRAPERSPPDHAEGDPRRDRSSTSASSSRRSPAATTSSAAAPTAPAPRFRPRRTLGRLISSTDSHSTFHISFWSSGLM